MSKRFQGLGVALITPFTPEGDIDFPRTGEDGAPCCVQQGPLFGGFGKHRRGHADVG